MKTNFDCGIFFVYLMIFTTLNVASTLFFSTFVVFGDISIGSNAMGNSVLEDMWFRVFGITFVLVEIFGLVVCYKVGQND